MSKKKPCMSEQGPSTSSPRAWRFYVDDMIGFATNVLAASAVSVEPFFH